MLKIRSFGLVIWLACSLFVAPMGAARGGDAADKLIDAVERLGHAINDPQGVALGCARDLLCIAKFLRDRVGPPAVLRPDEGAPAAKGQPWAPPPPAISRITTDGNGQWIQILRFEAMPLSKALNDSADVPGPLVVDLRRLAPMPSLDHMRRAAGVFCGLRDRAFRFHYPNGNIVDYQVPKMARRVDAESLSIVLPTDAGGVATAFAALLKACAGAQILSAGRSGSAYVLRTIPVMHGWVLDVPSGRLDVPGVDMTDGLQPDGPVPD